jgi:hypothetical protein
LGGTYDAVQEAASIDLEMVVVNQNSKMTGKQLKESFSEFYRGLVLLESYCELNHEAIRKIVKKFDKTFGTSTQSFYMTSVIAPMDWSKHATLKLFITETEVNYLITHMF